MERLTHYQLRKNDIGVLFEDEALIVLDKPAGLLVIPDRFDESLPNILSILRESEPSIFTVHRLDRDTSGCIIFARTAIAHAALNQQFEQHDVRKTYQALCAGNVGDAEGTITLPLAEDPSTHAMRIDRKRGKESRTAYTVIESIRGFSVVEARPETGRTHQIRVHLAAVGLPILCDPLYGDGKPFFLSSVKRRYKEGKEAEKPLLARTALHARSIEFVHPSTGARTEVSAELPKDMRSSIRALRKWTE